MSKANPTTQQDASGSTMRIGALLVARKSLVELWREPQLLALTVLMPLFMLLVTYIGYGTTPKLLTHPVLILSTTSKAEPLLSLLEAQKYADGRPMFNLKPSPSLEAAESALKKQEASVILTFSEDAAGKLVTAVRGDATSMRFTTASTLLSNIITPYQDQVNGMPGVVIYRQQAFSIKAPQTEFQAYAPGMITFAILLLIPQTAMLVGRELRWGTLRRLQLTRITSGSLLAGFTLAQMVIAAIQVIIVFLAAWLMGFNNQGSLLLAMVIGFLLSFSAVGFGLLVACFTSDDSAAINVGATVTMFMVFLSGAFFAMPPMTVFTLYGHEIGAFDLLPATHGNLALSQVLISGAGLETVGFRLALMVGLSLAFFAASVVIFSKLKLRAQ